MTPLVAPYWPEGHAKHTTAPPRLYLPAEHVTAVDDVDPGGHTYPAVQLPEQPGVDSADVAPKVPPGQSEHTPMPAVL